MDATCASVSTSTEASGASKADELDGMKPAIQAGIGFEAVAGAENDADGVPVPGTTTTTPSPTATANAKPDNKRLKKRKMILDPKRIAQLAELDTSSSASPTSSTSTTPHPHPIPNPLPQSRISTPIVIVLCSSPSCNAVLTPSKDGFEGCYLRKCWRCRGFESPLNYVSGSESDWSRMPSRAGSGSSGGNRSTSTSTPALGPVAGPALVSGLVPIPIPMGTRTNPSYSSIAHALGPLPPPSMSISASHRHSPYPYPYPQTRPRSRSTSAPKLISTSTPQRTPNAPRAHTPLSNANTNANAHILLTKLNIRGNPYPVASCVVPPVPVLVPAPVPVSVPAAGGSSGSSQDVPPWSQLHQAIVHRAPAPAPGPGAPHHSQPRLGPRPRPPSTSQMQGELDIPFFDQAFSLSDISEREYPSLPYPNTTRTDICISQAVQQRERLDRLERERRLEHQRQQEKWRVNTNTRKGDVEEVIWKRREAERDAREEEREGRRRYGYLHRPGHGMGMGTVVNEGWIPHPADARRSLSQGGNGSWQQQAQVHIPSTTTATTSATPTPIPSKSQSHAQGPAQSNAIATLIPNANANAKPSGAATTATSTALIPIPAPPSGTIPPLTSTATTPTATSSSLSSFSFSDQIDTNANANANVPLPSNPNLDAVHNTNAERTGSTSTSTSLPDSDSLTHTGTHTHAHTPPNPNTPTPIHTNTDTTSSTNTNTNNADVCSNFPTHDVMSNTTTTTTSNTVTGPDTNDIDIDIVTSLPHPNAHAHTNINDVVNCSSPTVNTNTQFSVSAPAPSISADADSDSDSPAKPVGSGAAKKEEEEEEERKAHPKANADINIDMDVDVDASVHVEGEVKTPTPGLSRSASPSSSVSVSTPSTTSLPHTPAAIVKCGLGDGMDLVKAVRDAVQTAIHSTIIDHPEIDWKEFEVYPELLYPPADGSDISPRSSSLPFRPPHKTTEIVDLTLYNDDVDVDVGSGSNSDSDANTSTNTDATSTKLTPASTHVQRVVGWNQAQAQPSTSSPPHSVPNIARYTSALPAAPVLVPSHTRPTQPANQANIPCEGSTVPIPTQLTTSTRIVTPNSTIPPPGIGIGIRICSTPSCNGLIKGESTSSVKRCLECIRQRWAGRGAVVKGDKSKSKSFGLSSSTTMPTGDSDTDTDAQESNSDESEDEDEDGERGRKTTGSTTFKIRIPSILWRARGVEQEVRRAHQLHQLEKETRGRRGEMNEKEKKRNKEKQKKKKKKRVKWADGYEDSSDDRIDDESGSDDSLSDIGSGSEDESVSGDEEEEEEGKIRGWDSDLTELSGGEREEGMGMECPGVGAGRGEDLGGLGVGLGLETGKEKEKKGKEDEMSVENSAALNSVKAGEVDVDMDVDVEDHEAGVARDLKDREEEEDHPERTDMAMDVDDYDCPEGEGDAKGTATPSGLRIRIPMPLTLPLPTPMPPQRKDSSAAGDADVEMEVDDADAYDNGDNGEDAGKASPVSESTFENALTTTHTTATATAPIPEPTTSFSTPTSREDVPPPGYSSNRCTIRKCQQFLPLDYTWKLCQGCRKHHREYQRKRFGIKGREEYDAEGRENEVPVQGVESQKSIDVDMSMDANHTTSSGSGSSRGNGLVLGWNPSKKMQKATPNQATSSSASSSRTSTPPITTSSSSPEEDTIFSPSAYDALPPNYVLRDPSPKNLIVPGARICNIRACRHILPSFDEWRWKMCYLCKVKVNKTRKIREVKGLLNPQRGEKGKGKTNEQEIPDDEGGGVGVDDGILEPNAKENVELEAYIQALTTRYEEEAETFDPPRVEKRVWTGRCANQDCGVRLDEETLQEIQNKLKEWRRRGGNKAEIDAFVGSNECEQCTWRRATPEEKKKRPAIHERVIAGKGVDAVPEPREMGKIRLTLLKSAGKGTHRPRKPLPPEKPRSQPPYPEYQCLSRLLHNFQHLLTQFFEARSAYMSTHPAAIGQTQAKFRFDGEYSVVALDLGVLSRKEKVAKSVSMIVREIERVGRLSFFPNSRTSSIIYQGIATRFACRHRVVTYIPAPPSTTTKHPGLISVAQDMIGELEIVTVPIDNHRLFPGERTVVRFRLLG
ncbi:hypothetical protein D9758_017589 [Tetrapyrgos nigripes]|uniref:Uncharacterized protein n=1 Tax=Tetrapyrgos nigripes TaxID=182062 RepID=A0A8H5FEL6_9AGAR|nr:hypothetical protein D9758_017589 [Tetrapyrgos nigripes]